MYLLHLSNLNAGFFTSTDKKEERSKVEEKCCKTLLSWYGRRCWAYGITFSALGVYCESKSSYNDKIDMLVKRFEIGGIFVGNPKMNICSDLNVNVFRINRRVGTLPDKYYLKELIHNSDFSNLKSFDESSGISGLEAKIDNDFVEYRFVEEPDISDAEKKFIVSEINGEPTPKTQTLNEIFPLTKTDKGGNLEENPVPIKKEEPQIPIQTRSIPVQREENIQEDNIPLSDQPNFQEKEVKSEYPSIPYEQQQRVSPDLGRDVNAGTVTKPTSIDQSLPVYKEDTQSRFPIQHPIQDAVINKGGHPIDDEGRVGDPHYNQPQFTQPTNVARPEVNTGIDGGQVHPVASTLSDKETQAGGSRLDIKDVSV